MQPTVTFVRSVSLRLVALSAVAATLATLAFVLPAERAHAAVAESSSPGEKFGFATGGDILWNRTPAQQAAELDAIANAGTKWVRFDISWDTVQRGGPDGKGPHAEVPKRLDPFHRVDRAGTDEWQGSGGGHAAHQLGHVTVVSVREQIDPVHTKLLDPPGILDNLVNRASEQAWVPDDRPDVGKELDPRARNHLLNALHGGSADQVVGSDLDGGAR